MQVLKKGIDLSHYQGIVDWPAVKASGQVDFAIIRAGYRGYGTGKIVEDPRFRQNAEGATAAGIDVGFYFFSTAINDAEAREEAAWLVEHVRQYNPALPLVMDYEGYENPKYRTYGKTTKASRTAMCKAFAEVIESQGYTTMLYGSQGLIRSKFDLSALNYPIWCARYAGGYTQVIDSEEWFPNIGEYTSRIAVWQYTSIGRVPGIQGNVDLDAMYQDVTNADGEPEEKPDEPTAEMEAMGILKNLTECEIFCDCGTFRNGGRSSDVYADADCTTKIGSLDQGEQAVAFEPASGMVPVMYNVNSSRELKIGFVRQTAGEYIPGDNPYTDHSYQNGSTPEPIYADTGRKKKIGSLNPRERCDCAALANDLAVVRYDVDGTGNKKIGFAEWTGGVVQ